MSVLVDTNLLVRIADVHHPKSVVAADAVGRLLAQGETPQVVPQVIYEFWVVATRPLSNNGLGMTIEQTKSKVDELLTILVLLPETPAVFVEWQKIVLEFACKGKPAHDARLIAAMMVHGVGRILTFNGQDFARFHKIQILTPE